jgi:thiamine kinase
MSEAGGFAPARQVLAGISGFAQAEIARQLSDGPTHGSFQLNHGGRDFVLRLDKPAAAELGLNRHNEKLVLSAIAAGGLAPPPVYFDAVAGICLRPWVPGRSWSGDDLRNPENLAALAALLRRLHHLPAAGEDFDPLNAARRYAATVGTGRASELLRQAGEIHGSLQDGRPPGALCHNDLLGQNILFTGEQSERLALIDWEYAAVGDPFFDLAVVVQHHGLTPELAAGFLDAYRQGEVTDRDRQRLERQCLFYRCLLELWELRLAADKQP